MAAFSRFIFSASSIDTLRPPAISRNARLVIVLSIDAIHVAATTVATTMARRLEDGARPGVSALITIFSERSKPRPL